eukprot:Sspe_Gene.99154::Locus_72550_Transcript_1_1_Confidence_1.000_Length_527::g.99154::m.99154
MLPAAGHLPSQGTMWNQPTAREVFQDRSRRPLARELESVKQQTATPNEDSTPHHFLRFGSPLEMIVVGGRTCYRKVDLTTSDVPIEIAANPFPTQPPCPRGHVSRPLFSP